MFNISKILFNIVLGTIVCGLLIATSKPSLSTSALTTSTLHTQMPSLMQPPSAELSIDQQLLADLQASEAALIAQGSSSGTIVRYVATLLKANVVPNLPTTDAIGVAGAVQVGNRLVVRGDFSNLSSELRDYTTDPANPPNPKITSAVHIHKGMPTENGPFQYALTVTIDPTGLKGRFSGDYTLTSEQLQALSDGTLYVDIHTKQNRAGELRGAFRQL